LAGKNRLFNDPRLLIWYAEKNGVLPTNALRKDGNGTGEIKDCLSLEFVSSDIRDLYPEPDHRPAGFGT
jgi:hypothetical protein